MKMWSLLVLAAVTCGCATGYQQQGLTGGFSEAQLGPNMWRVSFKGNGYTSADRAQEMTLLRSADLALQGGFTHFIIVDSSSMVDLQQVDRPPTAAQTTGTVSHAYGSTYNFTANTQLSGAESWTISRPGSTNTIVAFKGEPPNARGAVYDARFVYDSLGKKLGVLK